MARTDKGTDRQSLTVDVSSEGNFKERIDKLIDSDGVGPRLRLNCFNILPWPFSRCGVYEVAERQR